LAKNLKKYIDGWKSSFGYSPYSSNKKFILVKYEDKGLYVQEGDTLEEFKQNFFKEFNINSKTKNFFLSCKDAAHRTTKIENEDTYKKYINYIVRYPKLIQPFFTSEEKVIHRNTKCSECGVSPVEGILYKCLSFGRGVYY